MGNMGNMGNNYQQTNQSNQSNNRTRSSRSRSGISTQNNGQDSSSSANRSSRTNRSRNASNPNPSISGGQGNRPSAPSAPGGTAGEGIQIQGGGAQGSPGAGTGSKTGVRRNITDRALQQNAILYLESSNTVGIIDQPLTVEIVLSNKKKEEFDRLAFSIQYDPNDMLLAAGKGADGAWLKAGVISLPTASAKVAAATGATENSVLAANSSLFTVKQNLVDSSNGLVFFELAAKKPVTQEGTVARLTFVPLREVQTNVSFLFVNPIQRDLEKEPLTCLNLAGEDRLGSSFSQSDGVVNLDLQIFKSQEDAQRQPSITKAGENSEEEEEKGAPINLSLVSRSTDVNVGDTVEVDVMVSNPDRKSFDSVNLLIAYNPRVLEPVDGDKNAEGINVFDSKYQDKFPLDFPILNRIDKEKGIIDYRKKTMRKPCRSQGALATIQFRAIRPTTKTTFRVFLSETRQEPTTGLSYRYQDRLGDSSDPFDGVTTCSIGVRPTTAYLTKDKY